METNSGTTDGGDSGADVTPTRTETPPGPIINLNVAGHVSVIHCAAGSRRSSHWHRSDHHYLFVISGVMDYYSRPVGSTEKPAHKTVFPGQMVFTGPNEEHWTTFELPTTMISVSRLHRTREQHEADLVRIPWHE